MKISLFVFLTTILGFSSTAFSEAAGMRKSAIICKAVRVDNGDEAAIEEAIKYLNSKITSDSEVISYDANTSGGSRNYFFPPFSVSAPTINSIESKFGDAKMFSVCITVTGASQQ